MPAWNTRAFCFAGICSLRQLVAGVWTGVTSGSAAGCEAGLRPAGDDLNASRGYAPGMGFARQVGQRPNQGHSPNFLGGADGEA